MRTWLAEGRIAAETLVWREGWRDWREAEGVFPQLSPAAEFPGLENVLAEPAAESFHSHTPKHRSGNRNLKYIFTGGLTLVVLLLFAVLIMVLVNQ